MVQGKRVIKATNPETGKWFSDKGQTGLIQLSKFAPALGKTAKMSAGGGGYRFENS